MTTRIIEARARLTAIDASGAAFSSFQQKIEGVNRAARGIGGGNLAAVERTLQQLDKLGAAMERVGRSMTLALTLPAGIAGRHMFGTNINFDKEMNALKARGDLSDQETARLRKNARDIGRDTQFMAAEAAAMQRILVQAGRSADEAQGMSRPLLNMAAFGDVSPEEAANTAIAALSAYRVPMKTVDEAAVATERVGDIIAKAANVSKASVRDIAEGFKYAAPLASRLNVSMEQLAASIATMVNNGLAGNEAGVAIRSMLVRTVRPTIDSRQAMAELGLTFEQFARSARELNIDEFAVGMKQTGLNLPDEAKARLKEKLAGKSLIGDRGEIWDALSQELLAVTKGGEADKRKVIGALNKSLASMIEDLDVDALMKALNDKGATVGHIARIFDARQGARLSTLLGGNFDEIFRKIRDESAGSSAKGAEIMMSGAPGAVKRLSSAYENLELALGESGVIDALADVMRAVARGLNSLAETNPAILKWSTYALAAAAAIGPLAIVLGKLASAAAVLGLSRLPPVVPGAVPSAAPGAIGSVGGVPSLVAGLYKSGIKGGLIGSALYMGGTTAIDAALGAMPKPSYPTGFDPNESHWTRLGRSLSIPDGGALSSSSRALEFADLERSRRAQAERIRDPEGARGRAMMGLPDPSATQSVRLAEPMDITGKVAMDPASKADVNVTIRVQGEGQVTGVSATSAGNIRANPGVSLGEFPGANP